MFIYHCNLLRWTGLWSQPVIGFNAAGSLYSNHPYSSLSNANEVACISVDDGSNFTNVIFKISAAPDPIQSQRLSCWRWYFNDIRTYPFIYYNYRFAPPCPCTEYQAWFDLRWSLFNSSSNQICYISRILHNEIGQLCCYDVAYGSSIESGQYSGGFLWFHPDADFTRYYNNDYMPKQDCCSVGLCNIYQQRRPLQTCEGYRLQMIGKHYGISTKSDKTKTYKLQ